MTILRVLVFIPLLFSLSLEARRRNTSNNKKNTRTVASEKNSSEPKECYEDNATGKLICDVDALDSQQMKSYQRQRAIDDCAIDPNVTRAQCTQFVDGKLNTETSPTSQVKTSVNREEFIQGCISNADKTEAECAKSWNEYSGNVGASAVGKCDGILDSDTGICSSSQKKDDPQDLAKETCASDSQSVASYCDSENQSWMRGIRDTVNTLGPMANQLNPSASTCGSIAAASTGAEASIASFKVMCKNAVESCVQSCAAANDSSAVTVCQRHKLKADEAQRSVASAMMTLQGSVATCKNAFGSLDNQAQAYCATNPASCQTNLGGLQTSNLQGDLANGSPGGSLDTPGTGGGNTGVGSTDASVGDLGDDGDGGIGTIAAAKQGEDIGGSKGGGGAASADSGSGGEAAGGGSGGKKESGLLTSILSGFFGTGGGSGSSGGGGGGWKSWFGGGKGGGDAYAGNQPNKVKGPDLRQFLPGGLKDPMKNRGIAGQLVGQDGMTGPHSDIWKQINNRYQYKRASLLP